MMTCRHSRTIAAEPYRVFFPLGILVGIAGVSLWPLWIMGVMESYPGPAHIRLMIEGFFTAFIFGFLGTAGPRMLEVRPFPPAFWAGILVLWLGAQVASLTGASNLAEVGFMLSVAVFLGGVAHRFTHRRGLPPPGFVIVILSLFLVVPAALSQMPAMQSMAPNLPAHLWLGGRGFLVEGFVLLPILGAMPFFFGRFGGLPPRHMPGDLPSPDRSWRRRALICAAAGIAILLAICLKASGLPRWGAGVQATTTAMFIWTQVPFRYRKPVGTLGRVAQISLLCLVAAPLVEMLWPGERLAWRHLLVIPGFQFVVVAVATWVIFAHAGHRARCQGRWIALWLIVAGWLIAAVSRIAAEFIPAIYENHLLYAAVFWIVSSLGWLWMLLPRLREDG